MSRAFLDTTIVVNILLKRDAAHHRCEIALRRFDTVSFPEYALKEMKSGALRAWMWLHNRCVSDGSFDRVIRAVQSISRQRNMLHSALEAIAETGSSKRMSMGSLAEKYGTAANEDVVHCDRMRLALRKRITVAWSRRYSFGAEISDRLSCFDDEEFAIRKGLIKFERLSCEWSRGCAIAKQMSQEPGKVAALRKIALSDPSRRENVKRAQVLRHVVRTPDRLINDSQCRSMGDAVFALLAPPDSVILTTNLRDHGPLAAALGKNAEEP